MVVQNNDSLFFEPQRFIDEKTNHSGTSILDEAGGACATPYKASQLEFPTSLKSSDGKHKLNYVHIGDKGSVFRGYTTCCGSQVINAMFSKVVVLNRNGIKNSDGSKYEAPNLPLLNVNAKHAFDPSVVPEPKHDTGPMSFMLQFVSPMLNPFGKTLENKDALPDASKADAVPITWE
jgi:hypothetical protein